MPNNNEKELIKEEKRMKDILDKEEKVPLIIPEDPLNPDDVVPIGLNGVIYAVPRGKEFMVPKSIAAIWRNSYKETVKAQKKIRETQNKEIQIMG